INIVSRPLVASHQNSSIPRRKPRREKHKQQNSCSRRREKHRGGEVGFMARSMGSVRFDSLGFVTLVRDLKL
ncbi:hypothetical protein AKJ16_DCAP21315, partial [Drosera capensis]